MITKNVKLYLEDGSPVRIPVSQFDTMWQFVFTIVNNSQLWQIPSGASAVLNGRKPDGNVFAFSGTIADNKVTVDCDVQMTAVAGSVICELSILSSGKVVGTANFELDVEVAPKSPDDVSSESTLPAYEEMFRIAGNIPADIPGYVADYLDEHKDVLRPTDAQMEEAAGEWLTDHPEAYAPTTEQATTAIDAWLDAHPEATTTVQDGSISIAKLSADIKEQIETDAFVRETMYGDGKPWVRCNFVNNIPVQSDTGASYATDYLSVEDIRGKSITQVYDKSSMLRFYDTDKNYISNAWGLVSPAKISNYPKGTAYVVAEKGGAIYCNAKEKVDVLSIVPKQMHTVSTATKKYTVSFPNEDGPNEITGLIPGEKYTVTVKGWAAAHGYNAAGLDVYWWGGNAGEKTVDNKATVRITNFTGNNGSTITIEGLFSEELLTIPEMKLLPSNFTEEIFDRIADGLGFSKGQNPAEVFYNCTHYGVIPANEDNTDALNALITTVHENGGGVIWMPVGKYNFASNLHTGTGMVECKSNVSIIGENIVGTILNVTGNTQRGKVLFLDAAGYGKTNPIVGCTFSNFTVDSSEATINTYDVLGKAFMLRYLKDCVFKDLRLLSTPATALGIDMLDNVVIDSVYVYRGGREWTSGGAGGAGIGIGTGAWDNENFVIRNCICEECGHFGIFLEDQGMFNAQHTTNSPKGQIIANNIVRNGRHYGVGVRGGKNVVITGNNIYENVGGVYMDYGAKDIVVTGNLIQGNTQVGFNYGNENAEHACENIAVMGNAFMDNAIGIKKTLAPIDSVEINNVFIGNTTDQ